MQEYRFKNVEYFYTPQDFIQDDHLIISGDEFKHIVKVLRKKTNDRITVTNGNGTIFESIIQEISADKIRCGIVSKYNSQNESSVEIWLAISLLKNPGKIDFLIEKTVELGVKKIIPITSDFTIGKQHNLDRWKKIGLSAMKQSHRAILPDIFECKSFSESLEIEADIKLIADIESNILLNQVKPSKGTSILIIIGPEGGFSEEEYKLASGKNFYRLNLSRMRLRSETAAIVAVSTLINIFS